jgi:hypothetical protein
VVDVAGGEAARDLTAELRRAGLRADRAFDGRSLKSQMKAADRSGARVALSLRPLRGGDQRTVPRPAVVGAVQDAARGEADGAVDGGAGRAEDGAAGGAEDGGAGRAEDGAAGGAGR